MENRREELEAIMPTLLKKITWKADKLAQSMKSKQDLIDFELLLHKYLHYNNELKDLK